MTDVRQENEDCSRNYYHDCHYNDDDDTTIECCISEQDVGIDIRDTAVPSSTNKGKNQQQQQQQKQKQSGVTITSLLFGGCANPATVCTRPSHRQDDSSVVVDMHMIDTTQYSYMYKQQEKKKPVPENRARNSLQKRLQRLNDLIINSKVANRRESAKFKVEQAREAANVNKKVNLSFDDAILRRRDAHFNNFSPGSISTTGVGANNNTCYGQGMAHHDGHHNPCPEKIESVEVCFPANVDFVPHQYCGNMARELVVTSFSNVETVAESLSLMYDSDPGDLKYAKRRAMKGRGLQKSRETTARVPDYDENFDGKSIVTAGKSIADSVTTLSLLHDFRQGELTLVDQTRITKCIGEFMNKRVSMVWHLQPSAKIKRGLTKKVKAWIELGSVLRTQVIHPKFSWAQDSSPGWKFMNASSQKKENMLNSIDLLDISRVIEVEEIDRSKFPFAMKSRSFIIEANNTSFLFELSDEKEKSNMVFGLKLLVSHFGAGVVARNDQIFEQFFNPVGAQVPGESPSVLRTGEASLHEC
mmetsp:Transcript_7280/g.10875  ORF Transcript_7280/g.10875 Transcript_7280/m.10875 type:complete len:529 (-) Transcript_7280:208-1794(-)